jgi:hypothetical protein
MGPVGATPDLRRPAGPVENHSRWAAVRRHTRGHLAKMASIRFMPLLISAFAAALLLGGTAVGGGSDTGSDDQEVSRLPVLVSRPASPAENLREIVPLISGGGLGAGYLAPPPLVPVRICPLLDLLTPARQLPGRLPNKTMRVLRPIHAPQTGCETN